MPYNQAEITREITDLEKKAVKTYQYVQTLLVKARDSEDLEAQSNLKRAKLYLEQYNKKIAEKKAELRTLQLTAPKPSQSKKVNPPLKDVKPSKKAAPAKKPTTPKVVKTLPPTTQKKMQTKPSSKKAIKVPQKLSLEPGKIQKKDGVYSYDFHLLKGSIVKHFGVEKKKLPAPMHRKDGIVLSCQSGATVFSPTDAEVVWIQRLYSYTLCILKHHKNHYTALYGMHYIFVSEGDHIIAGKPIGKLPDTNPSFLYLELRQEAKAINPLEWLS